MKDKILMFVIGLLVGAIITAAGFLIFGQNSAPTYDRANMGEGKMNMGNFVKGDMPNGRNGNSMETPPDAATENTTTQNS